MRDSRMTAAPRGVEARGTDRRAGLTIVEMLVVLAIIALLAALLVPAVGAARTQAMESASKSNLRQIGQASTTYAAGWNGRQWTVVDDNLGVYGNTIDQAVQNYRAVVGRPHPPIVAGFGAQGTQWGFHFDGSSAGGHLMPINFEGGLAYSGWFRYVNFKPFHDYLGGRFYSPIFWAPKDRVITPLIEECLNTPYEYDNDCLPDQSQGFALSSYSMSPAALFSAEVFRNEGAGGFQHPFGDDLPTGLKVPALEQVRYGDLKTQLLEHHWLQNPHQPCNPSFQPGSFDGCEPYYFNHGIESVPMTLFYDGHVEGLGVQEAMLADSRHEGQTGYGLWSRDTPWGPDGYLISDSWDFLANTSFHILTTDGIQGRDTIRK